MNKPICSLLFLTFVAFNTLWSQVQLKTNNLQLTVNGKGYLTSFRDLIQNREYVFPGNGSRMNPLLVLYSDQESFYPVAMVFNKDPGLMTLIYEPAAIRATIQVTSHPTHISFELISFTGISPVAIQWGPYAVTITEVVGETIGVVRNKDYAIGIQALNMHTMGGLMSEYYPDHNTNPENGQFREPEENRTATLLDGYSELRAYTREKEGGVMNSKIAFFGCPEPRVIDLIGNIELAENQPHPMYDGTWGKISPVMKENWMVTNISEENIDEILEFARKANLTCIHTMSPFETWGHFQLNKKNFPNGLDGLKACVEKAAKYNIVVGIHCLSNFITTNDPYVTPVPDIRLAYDIKTGLDQDLGPTSTTFMIKDTVNFGDYVKVNEPWSGVRTNNLRTVRIDNELIQYGSVAPDQFFRLVDCKRGAFGTVPAFHEAGAEVAKLWDHGYRVFFPSFEMQEEMAHRLAEIINYAGIREISFDGLEGCFFSGLGMYAAVQFVKECLEHVDHVMFCDASITSHNLWHYFSRMTWGDENYQNATRVGTLKFKNQAFYKRNYIPPMMGAGLKLTTLTWNRLASTVDDAEWQLSKNAGYDAGYGIDASINTIRNLGNIDEIIRISNIWEEARSLNAFSPDQKKRLADPAGEWHLEKTGEGQWLLSPMKYHEFDCDSLSSKPALFSLTNDFDKQDFQFILHVSGRSIADQTTIENPSFRINGQTLVFPLELHQNEYMVYKGGSTGWIYDSNWHQIKEFKAIYKKLPFILNGKQEIRFAVRKDKNARVSIRVRLTGKQEPVTVSAGKS